MKPPRIKGVLYFVDREESIQKVMACLQDVGCLYVNDTEGIEGIGKTTLLAKLYEDICQGGIYYPVWVTMADFDPRRKGETGDRDSTATLHRNFEQYRWLLVALAEDLLGEFFADFSAQVDTLCNIILAELLNRKINLGGVTIKTGDINAGMWSKLGEGSLKTGDVVIKIPDDDVRLAIGQARGTITREFV